MYKTNHFKLVSKNLLYDGIVYFIRIKAMATITVRKFRHHEQHCIGLITLPDLSHFIGDTVSYWAVAYDNKDWHLARLLSVDDRIMQAQQQQHFTDLHSTIPLGRTCHDSRRLPNATVLTMQRYL